MNREVSDQSAAPLLGGPHVESDRAAIERALEQAIAPRDGCPARLHDAIRYAVLAPGKRLRPLLVLAAARACEGDRDAALPAAVAVELVHTYSLVHDDLPAMDDDDLRRGRPTVHVQFDEATAILVGDALIPLAFETLVRGIPQADRAVRCCGALATAAGQTRLVGGQADDLAAEKRDEPGTISQLESIHRRKTAALLAASLQMGGIVAGADEDRIERLERFGQAIGLAFQITDDLLDSGGDPSRMGKRSAKDHGRGKLTYPALLGAEPSRQRARELIESAIGELAPWGDAAQPLVGLARFILDRTH